MGGRCAACDNAAEAPDGIAGLVAPPANPARGPSGGLPESGKVMPTSGPSIVVAVLLGLCIAADVVALLAGVEVYGVMRDFLAGNWGGDLGGRADAADAFYATAGIGQIAATVAAGIVFMVWFRRSRINAGVFDPEGQRMRQGWAVGAWFVPIGNLWLPKKIANDIWRSSTPPGPDGTIGRPASPRLMNAWWALWVASLVLGRLSAQLYEDAPDPTGIRNSVIAGFAADGLDIVAAALAIAFVLKLTTMQTFRAAHEHRFAAPRPPESVAGDDPK